MKGPINSEASKQKILSHLQKSFPKETWKIADINGHYIKIKSDFFRVHIRTAGDVYIYLRNWSTKWHEQPRSVELGRARDSSLDYLGLIDEAFKDALQSLFHIHDTVYEALKSLDPSDMDNG